jgi:hypothetical protein
MRSVCAGVAVSVAVALLGGCGGSGDDESTAGKVYAGKVQGKVVGRHAKSYANMEISFVATEGGLTYNGQVGADLTFELTVPAGEYTAWLGTAQVKTTIAKGANTVEVNVDNAGSGDGAARP